MIWVVFFVSVLSFVLIFFRVEPLWLQYLLLSAGLSCFVMMLLNQLKFSREKTRWWQKRSLIFSVLFFTVVASFLGRYYEKVFDFSQQQIYSLRGQTIDWLKKIDEPIEVLIFLRSDDKTYPFAKWLDEQAKKHTPHLQVTIKNINKEVLLTKRYDVHLTGETVLKSGERWIKVSDFKEKTLVTGLIRLLSKSQSMLCFVVGHGEPDLEDQSIDGLFVLNQFLNHVGYQTQAISLDQIQSEKTKGACGLIFLISPRSPFQPLEEEHLTHLMQETNTPFFVALAPEVPEAVAKTLTLDGITPTGRIVVDPKNLSKKVPITDIILQPTYGIPLASQVRGKIFLPDVQYLAIEEEAAVSPSWQPLLITTPGEPFHLMGDEEKNGPFTVAAYKHISQENERKTLPTRVVFGSGKFLINRHFDFGVHRQLVLALVSTLSGEKTAQWIEPPLQDENQMELSPTEIFWLKNMSLYGIPLLMFLVCFLGWFRRRITS